MQHTHEQQGMLQQYRLGKHHIQHDQVELGMNQEHMENM